MTEEERAAYLRLFGGAARGTRTLSRRAAGPVFAKAKMAEGEVDAIWVYAAAATHSALSPNHALPPAAGPSPGYGGWLVHGIKLLGRDFGRSQPPTG